MRKALGKGIAALLTSAEASKQPVINISLARIKINKYQARKDFNQEKLQELADSINSKGLIQPIIVSPEKDDFRLIAGERRLRAAKLANLKEIPAIVRKSTDEDIFEIALIENLQRENLGILEEAQAYQHLMGTFNLTQEQVAEKVHKERSVIANTLRLLNLPEEIKKALSKNLISAGHARSISGIKDGRLQLELMKKIISEKLTVREIEEIIGNMKTRPSVKKKTKQSKSPELLNLEEKLRTILGTKVQIIQKGKTGSIEIQWYSFEDLDRIMDIISHGRNKYK